MSATSAHGREPRRPAPSTGSPRTGRKSTSASIFKEPRGSCRPTATRAMPSSTIPDPTALSSSARRHAGRICAATSTMSGPRPGPGSPARRWTASVRSTTSSAPSPASPPMSAGPSGRNGASPRLTPSAPGPSSSSRASPARATSPEPSAMASAAGLPSTCSSATAAWPSTRMMLNSPFLHPRQVVLGLGGLSRQTSTIRA